MPLTETDVREALGLHTVMRADVLGAEVRAADGESGDHIFTGHAAVFGVRSVNLGSPAMPIYETIQRGAFRQALNEDQDVPYVVNHAGLPLARTAAKTLDLREDPRGLYVYARAAPTSVANDLALAMRAGNVRQMSFAFSIAEDIITEHTRDDGVTEYERTVVKVRTLYDVSAVTAPAYPQTDAAVRSRELRALADRCGLEVPDTAERTMELAERLAMDGGSDHEAREALHRDLVAGAKRRLSVAQARIHLTS